jgi:hypothetical protein
VLDRGSGEVMTMLGSFNLAQNEGAWSRYMYSAIRVQLLMPAQPPSHRIAAITT